MNHSRLHLYFSMLQRFFLTAQFVIVLTLIAAAHAQTVSVSAVKVIGSGFGSPIGVAVDQAGNVYVADFDNNAVKEIVAAGGYTTVISLGSSFHGPEGVAVDRAGDLFVADSNNNAVKEIVAVNGTIPAVNPTINIVGSGFSLPYGVALDAAGNLFVADRGNNAVKEILAVNGTIPATNPTIRTLVSGFILLSGVAVDGVGNLFIADTSRNTVEEILAVNGSIPSTNATTKTLGSGFLSPTGVAVDGNENVFVADTSNNAVKEIVAASGYTAVSSVSSGFADPEGVTVDQNGNIFVGDTGNSVVKKVFFAGANFSEVNVASTNSSPVTRDFFFNSAVKVGSISVLTQGTTNLDFTDAGTGTCKANTQYTAGAVCTVNINFSPTHPGQRFGAVELLDSSGNLLATGYVQGTGIGPQLTFSIQTQGTFSSSSQAALGSGLNQPNGLVLDGAGNLFVADTANNSVKEILAAGGYSTITTLASGFNHPEGIAIDGAGNLFVTDSGNNAVKELLAASGYSTVRTLVSGFNQPTGLAIDGDNNLYIADTGNNAVKVIFAASGYSTVNTLGGGFSNPSGIAIDASGDVFVADTGNNAVKEILSAAGYTTINTLGSGFSKPIGIAVDANANVFVTDLENNAVIEILSVGNYATVNTLGGGFSAPRGVTLDSSGNVFVTDSNNSILKLDFADTPSLTFSSTPIGSTSADSPMTITLSNNGNAPLLIPIPVTSDNPSISNNFSWNSNGETSCQLLTSNSSTAATLAAGTACTLPISFTPTEIGSLSGQLVLTDNSLNAVAPNYAQQIIQLNGTGQLLATSIQLTSNTNPILVTNRVTLTATLTAAATAPTGTVTFFDGSTPISTSTVIGGSISLSLTTLSVGSHILTASYSGDTNYVAVNSNALIEVVEDFSIAVVTSGTLTYTTSPDATVIYTVTLSPTDPATTFPSAITLAAHGGPTGTTLSFSQTTVAQGAPATPITLTIHLPLTSQQLAVQGQLPASSHTQSHSTYSLLSLLLLPLFSKLRKVSKRITRTAAILLLLLAGSISTLTLSGCGSNQIATIYSITITATSGSLTHSSTVWVTVN